MTELVTRREAVRALLAAGAMLGGGCAAGQSHEVGGAGTGRLAARPGRAIDGQTLSSGQLPLGLGGERDGLLHVPPGFDARTPGPLIVLLHGAGGSARGILSRLSSFADEAGCPLLVPDSRGPTWDAIRGEFGPDVRFLDRALEFAFGRVTVDPARLVVAGFSDGASYALAVGLVNGDLFPRVLAFSPGFVPPGRPSGRPEVFITHGDADPILPFAATSRRIAAALERTGYVVTLRAFTGGHTIPAALAREGLAWAVRRGP